MMQEYPVVKMKELRNYKIGDVVRLKKNGKLVEIAKYVSYTGSCKRCVFTRCLRHRIVGKSVAGHTKVLPMRWQRNGGGG